LSADALFPFDRGNISDITSSGRAELAKIAAYLRSNRFHHVEVRGYTDRLGTHSYNLDLSQRRASAVKSILVEEGIPAEKIQAEGLGEQDAIVQCRSGGGAELIQCLQPNRRVEIVTYVAYDPHWKRRSRR
jgi:OOP family OmpA-OmpF porin